jgi:ABC-type uncharacterized transport system involved in gliding motility auxiliary subunit
MRAWTSLLGGLGLVFTLFGLVSVLLLLFGAPTDLYWIYANFGIGLLLLAGWSVSGFEALRERLRSGEARRAGKYGTSAVVGALAALAILGLLGFLSNRYSKRFDWSEASVHSLSDQTVKVLQGLEQDVQVIGFYSALERPPIEELLDRYAYTAGERFHVEFADPTARPDLVEQHQITREKLARGLLLVKLGGGDQVEIEEVDEPKLTQALVKLSRTTQKKVYFLEGHGERSIETAPAGPGDEGGDKDGYEQAKKALENENYRVEKLLLAARGSVPEDANVLVVPGPTRPLLPEELSALRDYVSRGGALFVAVDPRAQTNLYDALREWGVELGEDVVVDRVQGLFGRPATPIAAEYGDHDITRDLREVTLFHVVRSVRPTDAARPAFVDLVKTGPESWAERDLDTFFREGKAELKGDDQRGPVTLAVAGTIDLGDGAQPAPEAGAEAAPERTGRLVVFGDADFASNQLVDAYRNRDLFVNSVNWLLGDVEAISIRPNKSRASRLGQLSAEEFGRIRYLSLFVLPEALAVLGVWAWWSRRHAPGR